MQNTVAIKINQSSLVKNLKFAFSNSFTVLTELLQNSRRSGATEISVTNKEEAGEAILTVVDNGSGISDFQVLLTMAESGWNKELAEQESAFGMGFFSAVFSARRVVVQSNGKTLDMDTEHMLSMQDVAILPVSEHLGQGTSVTLYGVDQKLVCRSKIEKVVYGFPVEVSLNGEVMKRGHAVDSKLEFIDTPVGKMHIAFDRIARTGRYRSLEYNAYLQGFLVASSYINSSANQDVVIHLDPSQFKGRMPDRDNLVNADESRNLFVSAAESMIFGWLENKLDEMGAKAFFNSYGLFTVYNHPELLNKAPDFLPAQALRRPTDLNKYSDHMETEIGHHVTREQLERGEVRIFETENEYFMEDDVDEGLWQYLYHAENCYTIVHNLPKEHWARQFIQNAKNDDDVVITAVGKGKTTRFNGDYVEQDVVLCDAVEIMCAGQPVLVQDSAIYSSTQGILVPVKQGQPGEVDSVLHVICGYYNNDDYNSAAFDKDESDLSRQLRHLASQNFSTAVSETLGRERLAVLDGAAGRQFFVQFAKEPTGKWGNEDVLVFDLDKVLSKLGISQDALDSAVASLAKEATQQEEQK